MILALLLACADAPEPAPEPTPQVEPTIELLDGPNRGLVAAYCTGCHAPALIRQNHLSRERWAATITWMEETQGLAPIPEPQRTQVLDYLEAVQGPQAVDGVDAADSPWAHPRYEPNPMWTSP